MCVFFCILRGLFFFFWDGIKSLTSLFRRHRSKQDFGDDVCLITGAAQGLGKVLALELARRNAAVVIWDIQKEKLQGVAEEIRDFGGTVYPYECDCSSREDIYRVAALVKEEVGDVSVLINNAGFLSGDTIMESDDRKVEQTFQVNTLAHFWVSIIIWA